MAVVGQPLTKPDNGWQRIETTDVRFALTGGWTTLSATGYSGGSTYYSQTPDDTAEFMFYGSGLRFIESIATNRTKRVDVYIDGVFDSSFSQNATTQNNVLVYEKTGLPLGVHTVKLINKGLSGEYFTFDAVDIDATGYLLAYVGSGSPVPDPGWKRYDDDSSSIKYEVFNSRTSGSSFYSRTITMMPNDGSGRVRFNFSGTKLRLISYKISSSSGFKVTIDGVDYGNVITKVSGRVFPMALVFEQLNLPPGMHSVLLEGIPGMVGYFYLDAIDIDPTGRLYHPDEVTSPGELTVGKRIRCNYRATSNAVGTFSNLGEETAEFIPRGGAVAPDGDFYALMAEDWNGNKILVADRNIQIDIMWDTLNNAGIASGSGVDLLEVKGYKVNARLLTGGIDNADKDNEWDKYVVGSTLNGAIPAGDKDNWNWGLGGVRTLTSTVTAALNTRRAVRSDTAVGYWGVLYTNQLSGFRPVFVISALPARMLFRDGNDMKVFDGTSWVTVGAYPPTDNMFIEKGMATNTPITKDQLALLGEVKVYVTDKEATTKTLRVSGVPKPVLVKAVGDLNVSAVENIDSFTLSAKESGNGAVRSLVSTDSGTTWLAYTNSQWEAVNAADLTEVKAKGMSISQFNAIPGAAWNLLLSKKLLRFAYYLEISSDADVAETSGLAAQFDMRGSWKKAIHGRDYDYEYPANDTLRVSLLSDGGFKVNYSDGSSGSGGSGSLQWEVF